MTDTREYSPLDLKIDIQTLQARSEELLEQVEGVTQWGHDLQTEALELIRDLTTLSTEGVI